MITVKNLFAYGNSQRSEHNGSRHYLTTTGARVPSVTTILGKSKDMTHLLEWRKRIGDAAADLISKESAGLGTMMHTHLECWVKGEPRPSGTNVGRVMARDMADVIIKNGLCDVSEVYGIEVPLCYDRIWAGTTDLVGIYKGEPCVIDFKTTIKPKKVGYIEDYFLQLTAYIWAHNQTFGTDIKRGVIFMASRDLQYQSFELEPSKLEYYQEAWLKRVMLYYDSHPLSFETTDEPLSS
jgi:hypothetical protein